MEWIEEVVKTQGLAGVGLVIMAGAVLTLFNKLMEVQEKRIQENGETKAVVERNASAMSALTEVIKAQSKG